MKAVLEGGSATEPGDYNVKLVIASLSLAAGQVSHALSSSIHRGCLRDLGKQDRGREGKIILVSPGLIGESYHEL